MDNIDKVKRAIAVVGDEPKKLLAEYDRIRGLINEERVIDGVRVKVEVPWGTFYDLKEQKPRSTPLKARVGVVLGKKKRK